MAQMVEVKSGVKWTSILSDVSNRMKIKPLPMAGTSNIRITAKHEGVDPEFGKHRQLDTLEVQKSPITT